MEIEISLVWIFALLLLGMASVIFVNILMQKLLYNRKIRIETKISKEFLRAFLKKNHHDLKRFFKSDKLIFLEKFTALRQLIEINDDNRKYIEEFLKHPSIEKKLINQLKGTNKYCRMEAAVYLGIIGTKKSQYALEESMRLEKNYNIKLYIANALADIQNPDSIADIVDSLEKCPKWYYDKVKHLIFAFNKGFFDYLPQIMSSKDNIKKELIIDFSKIFPAKKLKDYLIEYINDRFDLYQLQSDGYDEKNNTNDKCKGESEAVCGLNVARKMLGINSTDEGWILFKKAVDALTEVYHSDLDFGEFLHHRNLYIRRATVLALSNYTKRETIGKMALMIGQEEIQKEVIYGMSKLISEKPELILDLIERYKNENSSYKRSVYAEVLSNGIDSIILRLKNKNEAWVGDLLKELVRIGRVNAIIAFLNRNSDLELENDILSVLKNVLKEKEEYQEQFCNYLNDRIISKLGVVKCDRITEKHLEKKNPKVIRILMALLIFIVLIFPASFALLHWGDLFTNTWKDLLVKYVIDFNYYLVYYSLTINAIYILLLEASYRGADKQLKLWRLKKITFLFKKGILPSVSIIAPAFNEESNIIESANSLLNLRYPEYELIIVNDGSKDKTLRTLIEYYQLERIDFLEKGNIKTKNIRGIYRNKHIPRLIVADKENGGKADSLNVGINLAKNEYFCGIDADSLLEPDALLKLTSISIDEGNNCVAMGGNIMPINGCKVEKGNLEKINIPENFLGRFQTVEYIRAFMAGRVGWAYLNSLLIISGAFGLFNREKIIEIGGYLTSSGVYKKDTVGEDMELVVRLSRNLMEKNERYKVGYAFNANCWTEVPENYSTLKRQRDRWHRGLIDILTFHRSMMFNKKYGRLGMGVFPYFFTFEMMGPLIETQGYIMVGIAAVLGLLNYKIALLLFISTIVMGMIVSMASLLLAEKEIRYFNMKEMMTLILYSIAENFGARQWVSFWRVTAYFNSMKAPKGWGAMQRKGFGKS